MQIKPQLNGKLECVFEARRDEYYEIHKLSMWKLLKCRAKSYFSCGGEAPAVGTKAVVLFSAPDTFNSEK